MQTEAKFPAELSQAVSQYRNAHNDNYVLAFDMVETIKAFYGVAKLASLAKHLAKEVATLNPSSGEIGEGKARNLVELAEKVIELIEERK
jgi:hypothetical protein